MAVHELAEREKQAPHGLIRHWEPIASVALGLAAIAIIETLARLGYIPTLILPAPSLVFSALYQSLASGALWPHIVSTLSSTVLGFGVGFVVAIVVGSTLAVVPWLERVCLPYIVALQSLPKIAIAPILMLWFGYGFTSKLVIVAVVVFFPLMLNTLAGLRVRRREELELMQSLGSSRLQIYRYIRIPNALPYIFTGIHIASIYALLGTVIAEFLGTPMGLGYVMIQQRAMYNTPAVFAILIILMVIGVSIHLLIKYLEKKVVFWSKETSETSV